MGYHRGVVGMFPNLKSPRPPITARMEVGNRLNIQRLGECCFASHKSTIYPLCSQKKDLPPTTEDYRARFYEIYRVEAEDRDKEFFKKYDGDLNTTLIFVSLLLRSHTTC